MKEYNESEDRPCEKCKYFQYKDGDFPCNQCRYAFKNYFTKQTNREVLNNMNDEDFIDWLFDDFERMKFSFTNSRVGLLQWLKEKGK